MKKRFLAISLALALCVGLAVPAFATEAPETGEEAFKNVSVSSTLGVEDDDATYDTYVEKEQKIMEYEFDDKGDTVEVSKTVSGYNAIVEDSKITVTYSGTPKEDNSYIRVYVTAYIDRGKGVYDWEEFPHSVYLTNDGQFIADYMSPEDLGGLVELKAGEDVTFTLPKQYDVGEYNKETDEYEMIELTDVLYAVRLEKWYPDTETEVTDEDGYTYPVMTYFYETFVYKVDKDAVDKALANGPVDDKPADPEPTAPVFTDVEEGAWYAAPVAWAVEGKITNGTDDTHFSPTRDCTQVEILTFLYRAAREEGAASAADMDLAVEWAKEKGIIGDGFDGSKKCTRSTAVDYIWQAFDKPEAEKYSFNDVDAAAGYADAVSWAVENGVTNGTDMAAGEFSPDEICTRGQIVTFLHRAYVEEARLVVAG